MHDRACFLILTLALAPLADAAPLSVAQGRAAQRTGTRLVDVYYDISGGTPPYTVTLQGSLDGGATWTLPVTTVSGHVGTVTTAGSNRLITWNAGADWNGQVSGNVKFKVTAEDTPPFPDGFVLIPAGSFKMGDQSLPQVGGPNELPLHTVNVSAFYLGKYEVTTGLWDSVRAWGLKHGYTDLAAGNGSDVSKGADHPVHSITWYDMVKWCNARSEKDGLAPCYTVSGATYKTGQRVPDCNWNANGYRLPTEAEWERAARGGVAGKNFPWGTGTISHTQANFMVYSSNGTTNYYNYDSTPRPPGSVKYFFHPTYNDGVTPYSSPAGSFAPNGYGLYDMAGSVWERCWDWYGSYAADTQTNPRGPATGSYRIIRGGGWNTNASNARCAVRSNLPSDSAYQSIGFRVARGQF